MTRKVIKHGPSTLITSLPSSWVKRLGIRKGDDLYCREEGNQIVLSPMSTEHAQEITIDVRNLDPYLVDRFLARSYQKGYDMITLTHENLAVLDIIHKKIRELIGFEVMEQTDKICVIQSIADKINLDFDASLRKVFLMIKSMLEELSRAYAAKDSEKLANLYLHDLEVNRLAYYCLRCLNKEQLKESVPRYEKRLLYYLCETLEDLGDRAKAIAKSLSASKAVNKKMETLLGLLQEQYASAYNYFYKPGVEAANASLRQSRAIKSYVNEMLSTKLDSTELSALLLAGQAEHIISHIVTMRLDYIQEAR
ncbi:MAG: phosphate uptake regulator PhoU [Nanoarchaeota archaeon]|nr:phosphate uptake regulator PhoU [Nanoarchaeota archaeon]